ncbi:MAG: hypothetical protein AAB709_01415 [Patescibacteria group bacterium]
MKKASHQSENGGYIIGRQVFAKISAIEGIHLTQELSRDFQSFEQHRLSPEDRRQAIASKYVR